LRIDDEIADPHTNANMERYEEIFSKLRRETPVRWVEPAGYRPFWVISKYKDVKEIEMVPEIFSSTARTILLTIEEEAAIVQYTGGRTKPLRFIVDMDGTDHRYHRGVAQAWFMPKALQAIRSRIDALAETFVARMEAGGGRCDFVKDIASLYPLRVIMTLLGVPEEDEPLMLRYTREMLGSSDPDVQNGATSGEKIMESVQGFITYFREFAEKRKNATDDNVASVLVNAGLGQLELDSYFIILATAGHDTTSGTISGGLLELLRNPDQMQLLRDQPDLIDSAIDEMLRCVTPVKNFMRTATRDYELRGQTIRAGEEVMLCYASANRDEEIFDQPNRFMIGRRPNPHLAFGFGPHVCLGNNLAKMEIRSLFKALLDRFDDIALAGKPDWLIASQVSCLTALPVSYVSKVAQTV